MEDTIKIRLSFEDDEKILSPSQKSEGLNLCWFLLKPHMHHIIADITAHILYGFQLHKSCPNGIHLYIDGFMLGPFESTGILSISDTISVRKRSTVSLEASLKGQEAGNATSKKRKASADLHITKKKKQRSSAKKAFGFPVDALVLKSSQDKVRSSHNPKNKKQANNGKDKITNSDMQISADTKSYDEIQNNANDALEGLMESKKISESALCKKARRKQQWEMMKVELEKQTKQYSRETLAASKADTSQPKSCPSGEQTRPKSEQKNGDGKRDDGEPKGSGSRSARRKKLKRQRLRESKRHGYKYADTAYPNTSSQAKMNRMKKQCSGVQDDATANKVQKSSHDKVEASLAIIQKQELNPKKKKQGENAKDNITTSNLKISADRKSSNEIQNNANDALEGPEETKKISRSARRLRARRQRLRELKAEKQFSEVTLAVSKADTSQPMSWQQEEQTRPKSGQKNREKKRVFDELPPPCGLPKAGDVIIYRLLELSSSWTPELSRFRVGKVSWCSSETGKLLLMPVPEYPISSGMSFDDESHSQPDNSLYNEDGSLEIDLTALVDVRLLEDGSGSLTTSAEKAFRFPVDDAAAAALVVPSASNDTQINVSTNEDVQQMEEQTLTRPESEGNNRDGKRDDGEPKSLLLQNSRSARRKKAKRQRLRDSKKHEYTYVDTTSLESRMDGTDTPIQDTRIP